MRTTTIGKCPSQLSLKTVLFSALLFSVQNSSIKDIPQPTYAHESRLLNTLYPIFLSSFGASKSPKNRALKSLFLPAKSSQDLVFLLFPVRQKSVATSGRRNDGRYSLPSFFLLSLLRKARCIARVRSRSFPYSIPYLEGKRSSKPRRRISESRRLIGRRRNRLVQELFPFFSHFHPGEGPQKGLAPKFATRRSDVGPPPSSFAGGDF